MRSVILNINVCTNTFWYVLLCLHAVVSQVIKPKGRCLHFLDSNNPNGFGSQKNLTLFRFSFTHIWPKFRVGHSSVPVFLRFDCGPSSKLAFVMVCACFFA